MFIQFNVEKYPDTSRYMLVGPCFSRTRLKHCQPCGQLKKHVCHKLFQANSFTERSVCRTLVDRDVFTWLPLAGNGKSGDCQLLSE